MEGGGSATVSSIITAMTTAFSSIQSDALTALTALVPIALVIFGAVWLSKKIPNWFKGVTH